MSGKSNKNPVVISTGRKGQANRKLEEMLKDGDLDRVELALVFRDEDQPRSLESVMDGIEVFAKRLKREGIIHPPVLRRMKDGTYKIVDGERRVTAAKLNGEITISALCKNFTDEDVQLIYELQYSANDPENNKPLTPYEDALYWRNYADRYFKGNLSTAAEAQGVSKTLVFAKVSILKVRPPVLDFIKHEVKDSTTAAALAAVDQKSHVEADTWIMEFRNNNLPNIRQSAIELNKSLLEEKRKASGKKRAEKVKIAPVIIEEQKEHIADKPTFNVSSKPTINVVVKPSGVNDFILDEKTLLTCIEAGKEQGKFLGNAFLSVIKKTPFLYSLGAIYDLDDQAYKLFYQILELSDPKVYEGHGKAIELLVDKVSDLLNIAE